MLSGPDSPTSGRSKINTLNEVVFVFSFMTDGRQCDQDVQGSDIKLFHVFISLLTNLQESRSDHRTSPGRRSESSRVTVSGSVERAVFVWC